MVRRGGKGIVYLAKLDICTKMNIKIGRLISQIPKRGTYVIKASSPDELIIALM